MSTDTLAEESPRLGRLVGRSAAWSVASNLVMRFASIAVTAVLARLLSPEDFGTFAIALALFLVVSSLAELGMGSAVARSAEEPDDIAPTVASISIGGSAVLAVLMFLTATPLAAALGQPDAAGPIRVLSLSLALTGVFTVPAAQLVREFRQDRVFLATIVAFVVSNPILIVLALQGGGATAFAWSRVIGQVAGGLVMVWSTQRRYRPGWRPAAVRGLLVFGLPLSLANLVNYALINADYLIIGRLADAALVGVYMIAFNVANWSTALMGSVLNTVVVPAFGRVSRDREQLGRALVSATQLVALVALPIATMSLALADPLVAVLFGSTWSDAAPVLAVLAIYGGLYSFSLLYANVLVATGATRRLLAIQLAWVAVLVPGIVVGYRAAGLVGAAWGHVVTIALVAVPGYAWAALRTTGQDLRTVRDSLARPASAAVAAGIAAALVTLAPLTPVLVVLLGGLCGLAAYLAVAAPVLVRILPAGVLRRLRLAPEPGRHRIGSAA
jgi:lipopolysaccharide exporter